MLKVIIKFDYKRLEYKFYLLNIILQALAIKNLSFIDKCIDVLTEEKPYRHKHLLKLITNATDDLYIAGDPYVWQLYSDGYELVDAESCGPDLILVMEDISMVDDYPHE